MKRFNFLTYALFAILAFGSATITSCNKDDDKDNLPENSLTDYKTPKYVFYFIGDGMSSPQINLAEVALKDPDFRKKNTNGLGILNLQQFAVTGMQTTHAEDRYITGSAASATALSTGYKTAIGHISVKSDGSTKLKTMAEMAKDKGMKVGIVSSVSIDHATPACFYAHQQSRGMYQEIGQDLINSGFDFFAGGNVRHNKYSGYDLNAFISDAEAKGYSYVNTKAGFDGLKAGSGKTIATLKKLESFTSDGCAMPYAMDAHLEDSEDNKISLAQFTEKAIEVLDNDNGFFIMVEGGKIDWACHANDAVAATHDMIAFDDAVGKALKFYQEHKDETLIVVTGDHECGGLTLGFSATKYETAFDILKNQKTSFLAFTEKIATWDASKTFEQALAEVNTEFGLGDSKKGLGLSDYEKKLLESAFNKSMGKEQVEGDGDYIAYGGYDPFTVTVTHILNNKAGIDWTSYKHTAVPVPVFAIGQGQYEFNGYYDNTDVAKRIIKVAKLQE